MRYQNTKTGAVVDSPFKLSGENWELFEESKEVETVEDLEEETEAVEKVEVPDETVEEQPEEKEVVPEQPEDLESYDGITVKQIKQELDAFGIEYDPRAKKKELYDLMLQGK